MYDNSSAPTLTSTVLHGLHDGVSVSMSNKPLLFAVILPLFLPLLLRFRKKWQYIVHGRQVLIDGIKKHGSKPFKVPGLLGTITVFPVEYVQELKHSNFSFTEYVDDAYPRTGMKELFSSRSVATLVKRNLHSSLNRFSPEINDEILFASKLLLENKTVKAKHALTSFISRVNCRVFAGPELCRNERWLELILLFTEYIGMTGMILRLVPRGIAGFIAVLIPGYWMAKNAAKEVEKMKGEDHEFQLFLSASAIHTTSAALTQMVYDLCLYPETVEILRKEVEEVGTDELHKLMKMDSFMKESQRLNPITHVAMQRKAIVDMTLHDGVQVKKDEYVMVASTPTLINEELYPDPDKFDPLRFYKLRKLEGKENTHQFVSTNDEFFAFSRGPHTCPGRFFAAHVLKLSLAHFLMEYDLSFPAGQTQRPPNLEFEENCFPNSKQKVIFTKRTVAS